MLLDLVVVTDSGQLSGPVLVTLSRVGPVSAGNGCRAFFISLFAGW